MMNIIDLPVDILLNIFVRLQLSDLLALRKTCKDLESVTRERNIWHRALSVRFLQRGLPIPGIASHSIDLSSLSSTKIERLAIRADRLWANWTSPQPRRYTTIDLRPTHRPWASVSSRNLATEFLPGWNGKYLLTLTLFDYSSDAENRRYSFELWDIGTPDTTKPIAELLVAGLLGYAVNSESDSPHVLSVTRRNLNQLVSSTYTIDFSTPGVDPWFRRTSEFNSFRTTLGLQGSYFVAVDTDQEVRLINVDNGQLVCLLKIPLIHNDPTIRLQEHQCLDYDIFGDFVLTFCKQWIYLYYIGSSTLHPVNEAGSEVAIPRLDPIERYKWRWRIDTIAVNPRRLPSSPSSSPPHSLNSVPPPIDMLFRFDTWYPWPVNILHHFVLPSNPSFSASTFSLSDRSTYPYLATPSDGPYMVHSIPSPVRLFTPSDMVLGPYGTALWLDASTDPTTPSQAGDRGQRIAFKVIAGPGASSQHRRLHQAQTESEVVDPGVEDLPALLNAVALDSHAGETMVADSDVSVLAVQDQHEFWNRVSVNEEEGQVAIGHTDGRVSVYVYAPPA